MSLNLTGSQFYLLRAVKLEGSAGVPFATDAEGLYWLERKGLIQRNEQGNAVISQKAIDAGFNPL